MCWTLFQLNCCKNPDLDHYFLSVNATDKKDPTDVDLHKLCAVKSGTTAVFR